MRRLLFLFLVLWFSISLGAEASWLDSGLFERDDGRYFTLQDGENNILTYTARILDLGDSYISSDNQRYEVVGIEDDLIRVELKEKIELPSISELMAAPPQNDENDWNVIGIYHTHNAESYVPTSGVDSKTEGDIMEVGKELASALENLGYEVIWSDNSHLPHDGQAYNRSRRTAVELIEHRPATLIDVHRDATPPEVYETEIEGQPTTKIRIVVGRQNENREMTLEYAKRIKAIGDETYPGIIEGIFDARGNYNQDLGPRMILLEFGAHTNPLELAEQSAQFFAEILPAAAGLTTQGSTQDESQAWSTAGRSIFWIIAITGGILVVYLLLNKQDLAIFGKRDDDE